MSSESRKFMKEMQSVGDVIGIFTDKIFVDFPLAFVSAVS